MVRTAEKGTVTPGLLGAGLAAALRLARSDKVTQRLEELQRKLNAAAKLGTDPFPDRVPGEEFIALLRERAQARS